MDFELSEEQGQFQDSLRRFAAAEYAPDQRERYLASPAGFDAGVWRRLAELGLAALSIPEDRGGFGGGLCDVAAAMEALGPAMIVDPWLPALLAGGILAAADEAGLLGRLVAGEACVAVALAEPNTPQMLAHVGTAAVKVAGGWRLDGHKTMVLGGEMAEAVLLLARSSGAAGDQDGISLFLIDPRAPGVSQRSYRLADGSHAGEMRLQAAEVLDEALIGAAGAGYPLWEDAAACACVALAAEAIGLMDAAMQGTLEHLRTRQQFGAAIGSFQAVQHRMANCAARLELARGLVAKAAILADDPDTSRPERLRAAFGAKAFASDTAMLIAEECVQFHGAIGITQELFVGRAMKRLLLIAAMFGPPRALLHQRGALFDKGGR